MPAILIHVWDLLKPNSGVPIHEHTQVLKLK